MSDWSFYEIPGEVHIIPTIVLSKTFHKPVPPHIVDDMCICGPKVDSIINGVKFFIHQEEN